MSASEMGWRAVDVTRRQTWSRNQVAPGSVFPNPPAFRSAVGSGGSPRRFDAVLPAGTVTRVPADAAAPVIAAAAGILAGEWSILGVPRKDIASPEWFLDPVTSIKAPQAEYCFRHRSPPRGSDGQRQAGVGAVPDAPHHGAGRGLCPVGRRLLRRSGGRSARVLVGGQPFSVRDQLDERDRARSAAHRMGMDPPAAGGVAWRCRAIRGQ